jgi:hypothetical protein
MSFLFSQGTLRRREPGKENSHPEWRTAEEDTLRKHAKENKLKRKHPEENTLKRYIMEPDRGDTESPEYGVSPPFGGVGVPRGAS